MIHLHLRLLSIAVGLAASLAAVTLASNDARACGGCFHPVAQNPTPSTETTVVTSHRMAFSISTERTILWDQVQYAGSPTEFAWVLPVRAGAYIELASDAWFEALDAATSTRVVSPIVSCFPSFPGGDFGDSGGWGEGSSHSGCACGGDDSSAFGAGGGGDFATSGSGGNLMPPPPPPVVVVHQGSVGPYETVTLHANVPGALPDWLTSNGFAIDASVQPIIDAYESEGFDFIALRLQPNQGVQQMKPVRVVSPGATPVLPLRMVAAGTGPTVSLTLFIIGEGHWESQNFPNAAVDYNKLTWDFLTQSSNYSVLRNQLFTEGGNAVWLTSYAKSGTLLSPSPNPTNFGAPVVYLAGNIGSSTIAALFADQAFLNGETSDVSCKARFGYYRDSMNLVVDLCGIPSGGGGAGGTGGTAGMGGIGGAAGMGGTGGTGDTCGVAGPGEIDSREFSCDNVDDLAAALVGMHPRDVWLTRLDAQLSQAALKEDFTLQAASVQGHVENWYRPSQFVGNPCPPGSTASISTGARSPTRNARTEIAWVSAAVLAAAAALVRRPRRRQTASWTAIQTLQTHVHRSDVLSG